MLQLILHRYEAELSSLRAQLQQRTQGLVDKRKLLEAEEERRRAEEDKLQAGTQLGVGGTRLKGHRAEWSGVERSGLEWSGVERSGLEWSGVVWSGLEWSGVVWSGLRQSEEARSRGELLDALIASGDPGAGDAISRGA